MEDKLFRAKVRIGHTETGKPIDKYVSAHSQEELERKKEATREHFIYGKPIPKATAFYEYPKMLSAKMLRRPPTRRRAADLPP